jgi:putative NADH-flavin reductase
MKVLIIGGTGGTGQLIVREARDRGHDVVAMVRSKEKAASLGQVHLVVGDATDESTLAAALSGCDAVISALGTPMSPFKEVTLLSTATAAMIHAMESQKVRRLICITGMGAGDSKGHGGFIFDRIFNPLMLRKIYVDKDRQESLIRSSHLQWIIIRPSVLNDKPATGRIRALTDLSSFHGGSISRADVAKFTVDQLTDDRYLKLTPLITW